MNRPRVLLVEDDSSIRRFVALALEDLEIDLVACVSVAAARQALQAAPVRLILTDLMMPGENGFDLLQQLTDSPALRGVARLVVFSANLSAAAQDRLVDFDIWRRLVKPIAVDELARCVRDAVTDSASPAAVEADTHTAQILRQDEATARFSANELTVIKSHFAGDHALFAEFCSGCLLQFAIDSDAGDRALSTGDWQALHHLAHSLKSVLSSLGHETAGDMARQLEAAAQAAQSDAAAWLWIDLRQALASLRR